MRKDASVETLEKLASRSGVSYGTVRRIRNAAETSVGIDAVEHLANFFGLSLVEFVSDYDDETELSLEERSVIKNLRYIDKDDARSHIKQIARMASLKRAADHAEAIAIESLNDQPKCG